MIIVAVQLPIYSPPSEAGTPAGQNIIFETDDDFENAGSQFVKKGNGSSSNPYLIADYDMGAYDIQIKNTTSSVILRNITFDRSNGRLI